MGNMSKRNQTIALVIIGISLLAALVYVFFRAGDMESPSASTDPLGQGIIDRWGAGLPEGYESVSVDSLDEEGYLFARLTYTQSVKDYLAKWNSVDETMSADFFAIYDKHCAADSLTDTQSALLADNKPYPNFTWIGYKLEGDSGQVLVLLYDTANDELFLAEQQ